MLQWGSYSNSIMLSLEIIETDEAWDQSLVNSSSNFLVNPSDEIVEELLANKHDLQEKSLSHFPVFNKKIARLKDDFLLHGIGFFIIKGTKVYVGASKFSNEFMQKFETFLKDFFISNGKEQNYEIPLNLFLSQSNVVLNYEKTELPWKNINYEADYQDAINYILPKIYGASNG